MEDYFISYRNYFWHWESSNEEVAVIRDGNTIAYKEFLFALIEKLSLRGLPPFGSILLAVVATNPQANESLSHIKELISRELETTDDVVLTQAMRFLNLLSRVPAQYKTQEKRILLLQTIFENIHNQLSLSDSKKITDACKNNTADFPNVLANLDDMTGVYLYDFRPLALLDSKFETEDDIIRKLSGVSDASQIEIDFEPPSLPEEIPGDLIDELIANERTFTTGSLVRWLWGGLNIPVHSSLPSAQPLGGISDLTNKGDFDKLLISEYGYDDFTFLSRLANNEALYIHREIPPTNNDLHRIILIDTSLKNWGTPKTIAFAVALAITRHPKTDIACQSYVLAKDKYHPLSTESVHTIIDGLSVVNAGLDTAASLELFLNEHQRDQNTEIFFVTASTTLKHSRLLRVMNEYHDAIHYLVLTDVEGNIDLYKKHQKSRKHIQHIQLPLGKLWQKKQKDTSEPEQITPFKSIPILIKPAKVKRLVNTSNGKVFAVTGDGAILKRISENHAKGWEVVCYDLPFKTDIFEAGLSERQECIVLLFNVAKREILLVNLDTQARNMFSFNEWQSASLPFIFDNGHFYHQNFTGTWQISIDGTITKMDTEFSKHKFHDRDHELKNVRQSSPIYHTNILKNINTVYINTKNEFVFNGHALHVKGGIFRIAPVVEKAEKATASKVHTGLFRFADGSTVEVKRFGVIILRSSNTRLADIYIPSFLDGAIGLATDSHFAGEEYFYRYSNCSITLISAGENTLQTIKLLKDTLGLSLQAARNFVHSTPCVILGKFTITQANELKRNLSAHGAEIDIQSPEGSIPQEKISPLFFYKDNLMPFIDNIVGHGS